jgi:hypothetical protein
VTIENGVSWDVLLSQLLLTANLVHSSLILFTLMMEALRSSQTSFHTRATRLNISEDYRLNICIVGNGFFSALSMKKLYNEIQQSLDNSPIVVRVVRLYSAWGYNWVTLFLGEVNVVTCCDSLKIEKVIYDNRERGTHF